MAKREEILFSMFNSAGFGLEIGPSYNPLVPKTKGFNVETLDYTDKAGLLDKYKNDPNVDTSRIEDVDYVSDGRAMVEVIGAEKLYDYIIASHVIEHTPDMLGFLNDCDRLLKPDGVLVLAVPDKRFCFDLLQPHTTTGTVLQANLEKRTRPLPGAVFDDGAYNVVRNGSIGWLEEDDGQLSFFSDLARATNNFNRALKATEYIDVHVWRFVPSSFRLIINDLNATEHCALREASFVPGTGNEFYISLSRAGKGSRLGRLDLALAANNELADTRTVETRGEITSLRTQLDAAHKQIRDLTVGAQAKAEIEQLRKMLIEKEGMLTAIHRSRSWMLTAPLRAISAVGKIWMRK